MLCINQYLVLFWMHKNKSGVWLLHSRKAATQHPCKFCRDNVLYIIFAFAGFWIGAYYTL